MMNTKQSTQSYRQSFDKLMAKLKQVYGENKYPEARADILFKRFGEIEFAALDSAVEKLIANNKYPPMAQDFEAVLKPQLDNIRNAQIQKFEERNKNNPCTACGNTGVLSLYNKHAVRGTESYAFKCYCPRGTFYYGSLPEAPRNENKYVRQKTGSSNKKPVRSVPENFVSNFDPNEFEF